MFVTNRNRGPLLLFLLIATALRDSFAAEIPNADLTKLSLEELMTVQVTSAGKKEQRLGEVAAALYVITQEEIARSGATSIPEALRMVPGLDVAQINASSWAVSSRGFNSNFANKLLVLMDGRSVYSPLFSGVFWDVQDTVLEDVERIEVIRGPAGTLWGANAVNGVINIITKNAKNTQGGLLSGGGGTEEQGFGALRYGAKLGDNFYFRVFGKYFSRDDFSGGGSGRDSHDEWKMGRGGFRADWDPGANDSLTFLGDFYDGSVGERFTVSSLSAPFSQTVVGNFPVSGASALARWRHILSNVSDLKLQFYYDRTERKSAIGNKETRDSIDLEFQHRFAPTEGQEMIWGLGYRFTRDQLKNSPSVLFAPKSRGDHLISGFLQNDFTLIDDRLRLTLGSKFEVNDYTGFELQPSARLLWTPRENHTFWGAISRAVRTPSRFEDDVRANLAVFPGPSALCPIAAPCQTAIFGDRDFVSETLVAYELGYRAQLTSRLSVDLATFYHRYKDLRTFEPRAPFLEVSPLPPHLAIPLQVDNKMDANGYGFEVAATWSPMDFWKLGLGYTFLKIHSSLDRSSGDTLSKSFVGDHPQNQFHLRSYLDLPHNVKLDTAIYYVDSVPNQNVGAYTRADLRLGWSPIRNLDLALVFQNLFDRRHSEFGSGFLTNPTKIERSVYGKITWRF